MELKRILVINGRRFLIKDKLDGSPVKIRRTFDQFVKDKIHGAKRRILDFLWVIGLYGCGGEAFALAPAQTDAGVQVKPDEASTETPDVRLGEPHLIEAGADVKTVDDKTDAGRDAAPNYPDASDACAETPSWPCGGTLVLPGRICVSYSGRSTQQDVPASCSQCPESCACIGPAATCGIFDGVATKFAGCVEVGPNQIEVSCQP